MNALGEKWMAKDLYELCPICDGEGVIGPPIRPCPECRGRCYIRTGYTVGEVERLRAEVDRLRAVSRA